MSIIHVGLEATSSFRPAGHRGIATPSSANEFPQVPRGRRAWMRWLDQARPRYDSCGLDRTITGNHSHLKAVRGGRWLEALKLNGSSTLDYGLSTDSFA